MYTTQARRGKKTSPENKKRICKNSNERKISNPIEQTEEVG